MTTAVFLDVLFRDYADPALLLELRPLPPTWRRLNRSPIPALRRFFSIHSEGRRRAVRHAAACAPNFNVHFGVLPRAPAAAGPPGAASCIPFAGALFADIDAGTEGLPAARRLLADAGKIDLPRPTAVVCSGHGVHAYWRLPAPEPISTPEDRRRFASVLRRLARAIGGAAPNAHCDLAACDVSRLLRMPGTLNLKSADRPVTVTLDALDPAAPRWSYAHWRAWLPAEPLSLPHEPTPPLRQGRPGPGLARWSLRPIPEGARHRQLAAAAAWLLRDLALPRDVAAGLLQRKADASRGTHPITPRELEEILRWA